MIPQPPFDPALPGLPNLLDETIVMELVASSLETSGPFEIIACPPRYVRYKPGTSCLVMYDLVTTEASGKQALRNMHIKAHHDDRGLLRATRSKMRRLTEQYARLQGSLPVTPVTYLPEVEGLLQIAPVDYDLKHLVWASSPTEMTRVFCEASPEYDDLTVTAAPEVVRYKPERKAMLRYSLDNGPAENLYGKLHADDRTQLLLNQTDALIEAEFGTPPVVAASPEHGFVAHAEAAGVQLASLRGTDAYTAWMTPLSHVLSRMQRIKVPSPVHTLRDEMMGIVTGVSLLERIVPDLAGRLFRVSDQLTSRLEAMDEQHATIHGDFYDDQALVSNAGATILDLDEMRCGHPLLDVGNMLAHLSVASSRGEQVDDARSAFLTAALQSGTTTRPDVALFEAVALMKLAPGPFRRLESNWPEGIERTLSLAERRLAASASRSVPASSMSSRSCRKATVVDAALPQLQALQDAKTMSARLAKAVGGFPPTVSGIDVVRHKPGRRASLRFEFTQHGERDMQQLYAKTFASSRGPKVYGITRMITAAKGFGPDIALPDPVAYLPDLKLLVQRPVDGESIVSALLHHDIGLATRIATALHHFHISGLDLGRCHDLNKELEPLEDRVNQVGDFWPALREQAAACLERVWTRSTSAASQWRHRPIHRDFYHDQLLIDHGRLAVLDLDDASMSEPAVDVANFASHLTLLVAQHPACAPSLVRVKDEFLGHYRFLDPNLDDSLVQLLTASTLLRLAGIHASRSYGEYVAQHLIRSCETALDAIDRKEDDQCRPLSRSGIVAVGSGIPDLG